MSTQNLQRLVGKAIISDTFRAGLLNGQRARLVSQFDLEPEEIKELMTIRAGTITEFAAAVEQIIAAHESAAADSRSNYYGSAVPQYAFNAND